MRNYIIIIILLNVLLFVISCGVPGNIQGGKKDSIAPFLVSSNVPQKSINLNLKTKKIKFYFNEFIQIKTPNKININPSFKIPLDIYFNKKRVVINTDSIKPNTTYVIDFNNNISDLNEGNEYKNFKWVFSTGNNIDTLKIKGKVIKAENNEPDSTAFVILHSKINDTVAIYNKPEYITKTNSKGEFEFTYLKPQPYLIFVLENAENNGLYSNSNLLFGFIDSLILPNKIDSNYLIRAYKTPKETKKKADKKYIKGKVVASYTTNLKDNVIDLTKDLILTYNTQLNKYDDKNIFICDSSYKNCFDLVGSLNFDTSLMQLKINFNWYPDTLYKLIIDSSFYLDTNIYIKKNDTISIKTLSIEKYGKAKIFFKDSFNLKNPILRIMLNKEIIETISLIDGENLTPLLKGGKYEVDIFDDISKDTKWSLGDYKKKIQAENLFKLKSDLIILENEIINYNIEFKPTPK